MSMKILLVLIIAASMVMPKEIELDLSYQEEVKKEVNIEPVEYDKYMGLPETLLISVFSTALGILIYHKVLEHKVYKEIERNK